jgi:hypothetical protein
MTIISLLYAYYGNLLSDDMTGGDHETSYSPSPVVERVFHARDGLLYQHRSCSRARQE